MSPNPLLRVAAISTTVATAAFLFASAVLVVQGMRDDVHEADVAVVLGNTVNPDGTPSHRLVARLDSFINMAYSRMSSSVVAWGAKASMKLWS